MVRSASFLPCQKLLTMEAPGDVVPPAGDSQLNVPISPVVPCSPTSQDSAASDDNSSEMAPGGKQRPNTPKREADFSALLTNGEKVELTSLINKAAES